jgi:hypothetical protein
MQSGGWQHVCQHGEVCRSVVVPLQQGSMHGAVRYCTALSCWCTPCRL